MDNNKNKLADKYLLTIPEIMEYTGIGEKKVRQMLNNSASTFTVRNGNKLYANKKLLEDYLDKCAKYQLTL